MVDGRRRVRPVDRRPRSPRLRRRLPARTDDVRRVVGVDVDVVRRLVLVQRRRRRHGHDRHIRTRLSGQLVVRTVHSTQLDFGEFSKTKHCHQNTGSLEAL